MDNITTIKQWLNNRGLSDEILFRARIRWDNEKITIPVMDKDGKILFYKFRRSPFKTEGPKYFYSRGSTATIYGLNLIGYETDVVVCEGELDALLLNSNGIPAVCSTGGAGTFKDEWFKMLEGKDLYFCFDNDPAGEEGIKRIAKMHPGIKVLRLPLEVGEHGDVTDYFQKIGDAHSFKKIIMGSYFQFFPKEMPLPKKKSFVNYYGNSRVEKAMNVPLTELVKIDNNGFALCPFHNERTPSFKIFKDNHYHCFGCGAHGNPINYVMKVYNLTFKDALDYLLK